MKIAVPFADGEVFQHFGHTENFKLYEIEAGQIVSSKIISADGSGHDALANFLSNLSLEFAFDKEEYINELRIQFDLDFERMSVSPNKKMRWFAQKLNQGLDFEPVKTAATIVKAFSVIADGEVVFETDNNYHSLVKIPLRINAKNITVKFSQTHGAEKVNIFACDFI